MDRKSKDSTVMNMFGRWGIYLAWVIACMATIGSLYFSEIKEMEPCHLCWYQRMAVFPLVIFLGIAAYRNDKEIIRYVLPLLFIGLILSLYMVVIQEVPSWRSIRLCGQGVDCTEKNTILWGWLSIPMLSSVAFICMIGFLIAASCKKDV